MNELDDADWMQLTRLNVGPRTTPLILRAQLHPAIVRSRVLQVAAPPRVGAGMTFEPVWIGDLELTGPIEDLVTPPDDGGAAYRHARLLVRVHGTPVAHRPRGPRPGPLPGGGPRRADPRRGRRPGRRAPARRRPAGERPGRRRAAARSTTPPVPPPGPYPERAEGLASVIVCTRDRSESLRIALTSILASDRGDFEVVVVDNAPATDATRTVVDELDDPRLRYVLEPRAGLSRARNRGAQEARGRLLAFTDDDVRVEPTWLGRLLNGFTRAPHVGCVTGLVVAAELATAAAGVLRVPDQLVDAARDPLLRPRRARDRRPDVPVPRRALRHGRELRGRP